MFPPSLPSLLPARALAEQVPPNASERFLEMFLPSGHPPLPGSLLRRPDLAEVLNALGTSGPAAFYAGGNLTLEMVAEVSVLVGVGERSISVGQRHLPTSFSSCLSCHIHLMRIVSI